MKSYILFAVALILAVSLAAVPARAQQVSTETLDGVRNFKRLETTVACAGAVNATAVADLKKMGFASIINLRRDTEAGADLEAESAAAKEADVRYYWIPFDGGMPDPAVADKFLDALTAQGSQPAFIHCASGNRAAAMWMIKRLVVDHWDAERAGQEATALGLTSGALKQFAIDYAQTHQR
jgi:uncharacterized protein (TIGR01244 family)